MTQEEFEEQLQVAIRKRKESASLHGLASLYWCGFARGLQRAFLERFSNNTDHFAWLGFLQDPDPWVAELGRGYREGLETVISNRLPNNSVGADDGAVHRPRQGKNAA